MSLDDNIGTMIDVMNKLRSLPPGMELCHYVGLEKSKYILNANSDLFCGHSNFMNDKNESWSGCRLFLKYLQQVLPTKPYAALEDNLRENSAMAKMNGNGYSYFMPYVMSLTPNEDSAYQWRHYTDNQKGGYCFQFDENLLRCAIQKRNKYNEYSSLYLAPCFYIDEDVANPRSRQARPSRIFARSQKSGVFREGRACPVRNREGFATTSDKDIIDSFMSQFINAAKEELTDIRTNFRTERKRGSFTKLIGAIFTLAPLFKDRQWRREREWRLILTKRPVVIGEQYVRTHLSEICEHPLNLMTSITMSPHGNQSELIWNLKSKFAFPPGFIRTSRISSTIVDYYITQQTIDPSYEEYVLTAANNNKGSIIVSEEIFKGESHHA